MQTEPYVIGIDASSTPDRLVYSIVRGGTLLRTVTEADILDWLERKAKSPGITNIESGNGPYSFRIELGPDGVDGESWGEDLRDCVLSGMIDDLEGA